MELQQILKFAVFNGISDVHLTAGRCPYFRKDGALLFQKGSPATTDDEMTAWADLLLDDRTRAELESQLSVDVSYQAADVGRFRASVYRQRGVLAAALRHVPKEIPSFSALSLPPVVEKIAAGRSGIVLVTGATGSGKSTTLASIIELINLRSTRHILTIEDPVEFIFDDRNSIVSQREIGVDAVDFTSALRSALRQDPDVIFIGELRDIETTRVALHAAETGHLVLSTMHTLDVVETIHRFISLFPPFEQELVRRQLSGVLKAVISQRLIPAQQGGRLPACEVLVQSELVRELIRDADRTHELRDTMAQGRAVYGMQTFDQALTDLALAGKISQQEAMANARNPSDMRMAFDGIASGEHGRR